MTRSRSRPATPAQFRCGIYTRKSTEEGLEQEYNTLDAQRDAGEAYIRSQQHEGWSCLPDRYDDGGFTGANMDRPALRRLLADIEAGKVQCVVVYKVDRLSRSLLDFARMMEIFDRHDVAFVSVTQAFNTASSMGRLILNVLLSFAQFEREMISERTRDKIAAARRKGKWAGGMPVLGYVVRDSKLVVDELEAELVRQIFALYLDHKSLLAAVKELNARGWRTKRWTTRKGHARGGRRFTKGSLYQLLTNVVYVGKVRYKEEVHDGEQEPIVPADLFAAVQGLLQANGAQGGRRVRNKHGALLRGLVHCAACGCTMSHSFTAKGPRRYRYYVCQNAQKRGWQECPAPSVPAGKLEQFVIDQLRCIGRDPALIRETVAQARELLASEQTRVGRERAALVAQLRDAKSALDQLAAAAPLGDARFADAVEAIHAAERRIGDLDQELAALAGQRIDAPTVAAALGDFDAVWQSLAPREQLRLVELLVDRVVFDGAAGKVAITFRAAGIDAFRRELAQHQEHVA